MPVADWKILQEEHFRYGYRQLITRAYELPNGKTAEFNLIHGSRVACMLPVTPENRIVLAKQYRPGPEKVLLELPGGLIEQNEEPLEAARRELLEETGYDGNFQFVGTNLVGFYMTIVRYNFVVTNCRKLREPQPDEYEFIETVEMPLDDFRQHLRTGELSDVSTGYLGLDYLKLL
jgi:ADP-ribose pyrophosphatase